MRDGEEIYYGVTIHLNDKGDWIAFFDGFPMVKYIFKNDCILTWENYIHKYPLDVSGINVYYHSEDELKRQIDKLRLLLPEEFI